MALNAKKRVERGDLNALLARLSQLDDCTPSSISDSERPDFIIVIAGKDIGVETTRSVRMECVRALKIQAEKSPNCWVNLTYLNDRLPRRSNSDLARNMSGGAILQRWSPVQTRMLNWKCKIASALQSKREKLCQPGYQVFPENWLLIHDFPPLPVDRLIFDLARSHLNHLLASPTTLTRDFDKVFIHSGEWLFRWFRNSLVVHPSYTP
jgi:hypothetical protein